MYPSTADAISISSQCSYRSQKRCICDGSSLFARRSFGIAFQRTLRKSRPSVTVPITTHALPATVRILIFRSLVPGGGRAIRDRGLSRWRSHHRGLSGARLDTNNRGLQRNTRSRHKGRNNRGGKRHRRHIRNKCRTGGMIRCRPWPKVRLERWLEARLRQHVRPRLRLGGRRRLQDRQQIRKHRGERGTDTAPPDSGALLGFLLNGGIPCGRPAIPSLVGRSPPADTHPILNSGQNYVIITRPDVVRIVRGTKPLIAPADAGRRREPSVGLVVHWRPAIGRPVTGRGHGAKQGPVTHVQPAGLTGLRRDPWHQWTNHGPIPLNRRRIFTEVTRPRVLLTLRRVIRP